MLKALKPSLEHDSKHVLQLLRPYGDLANSQIHSELIRELIVVLKLHVAVCLQQFSQRDIKVLEPHLSNVSVQTMKRYKQFSFLHHRK